MIVSSVVMTITPDLAKEMLAKNFDNRPLQRDAIAKYSYDLLNGTWGLTHQGIYLDCRGHLIDGQHRLHAIVMTGKSVPMLVTTDDLELTPQGPYDRGRLRDLSTVTGVHPLVLEVTRSLFRITGTRPNRLPDSEVKRVAGIVGDLAIILPKQFRRGLTNQHVRAAAVLAMANSSSPHEVLSQFKLVTTQTHDGMWPIVEAFERYMSDAAIRRQVPNSTESFVRAHKAFSARGRERMASRLVISDIDTARKICAEEAARFIGKMTVTELVRGFDRQSENQ